MAGSVYSKYKIGARQYFRITVIAAIESYYKRMEISL